MQHADDQSLVVRSRAGEQRAFAELVRRYQRRVYGLAYGMLHDADDAMDITQETFIKVHKYLDRFQGSSSFYTWVYRITVNLCIDLLRRQKKAAATEYDDALDLGEHAEAELLPGALSSRPDRDLDRQELRAMIDQALQTLSPTHRAVILLREVQGMSYKEIADAMEVSTGTGMSRLFHARRRMQIALGALMGQSTEEGQEAA